MCRASEMEISSHPKLSKPRFAENFILEENVSAFIRQKLVLVVPVSLGETIENRTFQNLQRSPHH